MEIVKLYHDGRKGATELHSEIPISNMGDSRWLDRKIADQFRNNSNKSYVSVVLQVNNNGSGLDSI